MESVLAYCGHPHLLSTFNEHGVSNNDLLFMLSDGLLPIGNEKGEEENPGPGVDDKF
jgi:hypothetical protein